MAGIAARARTLFISRNPQQPRRLGRAGRSVLAIAALAVIAFAASALIPGSHAAHAPRFSTRATARASDPKNTLPEHISKVYGASGSAKLYGEVDALRENEGVNLKGQLTSDLTPVPAADFKQPIAAYRRYAERWAGRFATAVAALRATLARGDRASSERAWNAAFFDFMHLGADYNLLPAGLTNQIAEVPSQLGSSHFPGLHRIEMGLWTGQPLRTLLPVAAGVARASHELTRVLPSVPIGILAYTLRIHEILEDAQRDLMNGTEVPWSGSGVEGTEAGVIATRELLATVKPIAQGRDNSYGESENWLVQLQKVLVSTRRANGTWPTLRQLTMLQHERIDGTLAGALGALEQVPQTLETPARAITGFASIPRQRGRKK